MDCLDLTYSKSKIENLTKKFAKFDLRSESDFYDKFYDVYHLDYRLIYKNANWKNIYNYLLYKYYRNEFIIKKYFIQQKLNKNSIVCFEELPILKSRIDLFSINGKSVAYEIKTKYDKLDRIKKQLNDYSKCFEFVYVICPYEKLDIIKKNIPSHIGIYCYSSSNIIKFFMVKAAKRSPILNPFFMLKNLNFSQLKLLFGTDNKEYIKNRFTDSQINQKFKKALKIKYSLKSTELKAKLNNHRSTLLNISSI